MVRRRRLGLAPGGDARLPGDALLRPGALAAALVLLLNDRWLKAAHPSWLSGKLSDFAICVLMPLVIVAFVEWGRWLVGRWRPAGRGVVLLACAVTGLWLAAIQLSPAAARLHVALFAALLPGSHPAVTPDPTDLLALAFLPLAARIQARAGARPADGPSGEAGAPFSSRRATAEGPR